MASNVVTFANTEYDMRWMDPYVTEGLNQKALVLPRGIYRGFGLTTSVVNLTVTIVADTALSDHLALIETQNGFSLTLRRTTGNFSADLSTFAGSTVVVALYGVYAPGVTTAAYIRVFTEAEYNALTDAERRELSILGTVVVPAAGLIPAANITYTRRTLPADQLSPGERLLCPVTRNPYFTFAESGSSNTYAVLYWSLNHGSPSDAVFQVSNIDPDMPPFALDLTGLVANPTTCAVAQYIECPLAAGKLIRLRARIKRTAIPPFVGSSYLYLRVANTDTGASTQHTLAVALTGVDAAYVTYETTYVMPSGRNALMEAGYYFGGTLNPGSALLLGSLDVLVETETDRPLPIESQRFPELPTWLLTFMSGLGINTDVQLWATSSGLFGDSRAGGTVAPPPFDWKGVLKLAAKKLSTAADAAVARIFTTRVASGVGQRTLIWEGMNAAGIPGFEGYPVRLYHTGVNFFFFDYDGWEIAINAEWDPATNQWHQDNALRTSTKFCATEVEMQQLTKAAGVADWADTAWDYAPMRLRNTLTTKSLFDGGLTIGGALLGSAANALYSRIRMDHAAIGTGTRTLLFEFPSPGGAPSIRIYRYYPAVGHEDLFITLNASWDGAQWNIDAGGVGRPVLIELDIQYGGIAYYTHPTAPASWGDADWGSDTINASKLYVDHESTPRGVRLMNGRIGFINTETTGAQPSNPAYDYASLLGNTTYAKNVCKCWGTLHTDAGGNVTVEDGFNIAAVSIVGSDIQVDFQVDMANDDYAVAPCSTNGLGAGIATAVSKATDHVRLGVYEFPGAGAWTGVVHVNLNTAARYIDFVIFGQQDT